MGGGETQAVTAVRRVAENAFGAAWTVVRMNPATGEANAVAQFQNCTPDWFPDSRHIIYSSRPAGQNDADGGDAAKAVGQKIALCREPTKDELADALAFLKAQGADARETAMADLCQVLFCLNEFLYVE